jgi:hypothetical protein
LLGQQNQFARAYVVREWRPLRRWNQALEPGFSYSWIGVHKNYCGCVRHLFRKLRRKLMDSPHLHSRARAEKIRHMCGHAVVATERIADGQHNRVHGLGSLDAIQ